MAEDTATAVQEKPKKTRPAADTEPSGQTAASSSELGRDPNEDFANAETVVDTLGRDPGPTEVTGTEGKRKIPSVASKVAKALGKKDSDILSFNERTRVIVTSDGGKYQLSRKGSALRHLAGPRPPADINLDVVDARVSSPLTGTAAAINSSVHEGIQSADERRAELKQRRVDLKNELKAVKAELKDLDEDDDSED